MRFAAACKLTYSSRPARTAAGGHIPIRKIADIGTEYHLVCYDELGNERTEPDGSHLSEAVRQRLANIAEPVTDVFLASHGWKGDVPAAIKQYDRWIGAIVALQGDLNSMRRRHPDFSPTIVALHWPSLPWGDESMSASGGSLLSATSEVQPSIEAEVDEYARRIADTPKARLAIRVIVEAARQGAATTTLSAPLLQAYATVFAESGLGSADASGQPGADQDGFDPAAIIAAARGLGGRSHGGGAPGLLGWSDDLRAALLMPLRQASFWKMKDRARVFGETGGHALLSQLQLAAPRARFHLMGHSFGCIVVSATVAGARGARPLPRPVNSLFLVQGALSLWSYAGDIPHAPGTPGYFHRILAGEWVRGPIVTTRSTHDTAVGTFYPLGARLKKQLVLGEEFPVYGGIGAFGIQGEAEAQDLPMQSEAFSYDFRPGAIYNLEASAVIKNGGGFSGAHSDIAHAEVAHAFWAAVLAGSPASAGAKRGGVKRAKPSVARNGPSSPAPAVQGAEQRWINAEVEDHASDKPLEVSRWYTLAFDVDIVRRATAAATVALADDRLFAQAEEEVLLTVQLDSTDFDISDRTRSLRLPRHGKSRTKARFDISPLHDGPSIVKATIHKDGNFIQQMDLTFDVGATQATVVQVSARGRPAAAAAVVRPRDVGLSIAPATGGYDCVVWGAVSSRARLPLQPAFLASAVDTARRELMKVVMHQDAAGEFVFQTGIDIPAADRDFALKTMARAGALLFQKLFFGPAAGADSKAMGGFLRHMASDRGKRLKLQILAESTPLPWGMLYVGDAAAGAVLDWDNFIGMRHVIEQIPLQTTLSVVDCEIPSDKPLLSVSVNFNNGIDMQMGSDFVAQQQAFWTAAQAARKHMHVTARTTSAELVQALRSDKTDDQIVYFYCHADSTGLASPGGPDTSSLVLSDASVTLGDLALDAPTTTQLRGSPLVFINACESAEMSPAFYDGFVPYFMAKGARGVVGTECKTPALFASAWAKRFFERFLDGEPLGEAFFGLRQEFLTQHGNPLGLLYAVHCDGDTQIAPALKAVA